MFTHVSYLLKIKEGKWRFTGLESTDVGRPVRYSYSLKMHRENDGVLFSDVTKHLRVYVRRCVFVHLKICTVLNSRKYYSYAKWTRVLLHA